MKTEVSITINGCAWLVSKVDAHSPGLMVGESECRGTCWSGTSSIYLSNELTRVTAPRVIRHELAHAWIWATQAVIPETWSEEDVCEIIGIYAQDIVDAANFILNRLWPGGCACENSGI